MRRDPTLALQLMVRLCRFEPSPLRGSLAALNDLRLRETYAELAMRHGVLGVTLAALERIDVEDELSSEALEDLSEPLRLLRRRASLWVLERDRVLAVLERYDIQPVVLKGAGLCTTYYQDAAERQFGDIDLLFQPTEVETATAVLLESGYRAKSEEATKGYRDHHFHYRLIHPQGFVVENHWALQRPDSPYRLDPIHFHRTAQRVSEIGGGTLRLPSPEMLLLHVASQNADDVFPRIARLIDVDRVVRERSQLEWDSLVETAIRSGLQSPLWLTLLSARRLVGSPVSNAALAELRPSRTAEFHIALLDPVRSLLKRRFVTSWATGSLLRYWLRPDRRSRRKMILDICRGATDPLAWLWHGDQKREVPRPSLLVRLRALGKMLGLQALLYLVAPVRFLVAGVRGVDRDLDFNG
jgi:hypothetical protein